MIYLIRPRVVIHGAFGSIARLSRRVGTEQLGLFYLEPRLVINDRARNPKRREFYSRLLGRARAALPDSNLRDESAQL